MAKLLLIEKDPVAAAVLEDRLRVAGHRVSASPGPGSSLIADEAEAPLSTRLAAPHLAALVPDCAGVLIWLAGADTRDQAQKIVQRLEAGAPAATGVLVAATPPAQKAADDLAKGKKKPVRGCHPGLP